MTRPKQLRINREQFDMLCGQRGRKTQVAEALAISDRTLRGWLSGASGPTSAELQKLVTILNELQMPVGPHRISTSVTAASLLAANNDWTIVYQECMNAVAKYGIAGLYGTDHLVADNIAWSCNGQLPFSGHFSGIEGVYEFYDRLLTITQFAPCGAAAFNAHSGSLSIAHAHRYVHGESGQSATFSQHITNEFDADGRLAGVTISFADPGFVQRFIVEGSIA